MVVLAFGYIVMSIADEQPRHEIIIVKRRNNDDDEGHHGGVWKIAFADFMTAMMCFFLVMWLINAANEQTKAAVASYFNPVKLIDRNSSKKGLEDLGDGPHSTGTSSDEPLEPSKKAGEDGKAQGGPASRSEATNVTEKEASNDKNLFANPYAVLSEIVNDTGINQNISTKGEGGAQAAGPATGASGGESFRDPFAPDFWSQQVGATDTAGGGEKPSSSSEPSPIEALAEPLAKNEDVASKPEAEKNENPTAEAVKAADAIREQLDKAFEPGEKLAQGLTVVASDKGVTISVTDQMDFGMFEIGSAMPRRELVLAMEKIGKVLETQKGKLTISGHTDARPFRSATYDNWRLSTARAHSAYYMLLRAGLDERRVKEIGGYADRDLKDPTDGFAAVNRRIEILLETGG